MVAQTDTCGLAAVCSSVVGRSFDIADRIDPPSACSSLSYTRRYDATSSCGFFERFLVKCCGDAYVTFSLGSSAGNTDRKCSFSASLRASMPREAPVCDRSLPAWKDYKCRGRCLGGMEKRSQYGPVFHPLVFLPTLALISTSKSTHSRRESSSTGAVRIAS